MPKHADKISFHIFYHSFRNKIFLHTGNLSVMTQFWRDTNLEVNLVLNWNSILAYKNNVTFLMISKPKIKEMLSSSFLIDLYSTFLGQNRTKGKERYKGRGEVKWFQESKFLYIQFFWIKSQLTLSCKRCYLYTWKYNSLEASKFKYQVCKLCNRRAIVSRDQMVR